MTRPAFVAEDGATAFDRGRIEGAKPFDATIPADAAPAPRLL
jgi:hypothetical protein